MLESDTCDREKKKDRSKQDWHCGEGVGRNSDSCQGGHLSIDLEETRDDHAETEEKNDSGSGNSHGKALG